MLAAVPSSFTVRRSGEISLTVKMVFFGKLFDFFDRGAVGAMFCREFFA